MTQLPARFANRQNRRQIVNAVTAGLGVSSPPYVSIKGGAFTLVDAGGNQVPVETKHLDCVIFDTNTEVAIQRTFWGNKPYNPNATGYEPPVCFSDNGIGASRNAQEPQSASCQACQWSAWGSATSKMTGKGVPACQSIKKVAVLVPGWDFPFLLRVPVMSHENLRQYGDKFRGQDFDVSEVVTRVSFVHGAVGQLQFEATGFTDDETEEVISKLLADKRTDSLVGRGDLPVSAELAAPKPVAQVEQKQWQEHAQALGQKEKAPKPVAQVENNDWPVEKGVSPFGGAAGQQDPKPAGRGRKPAAPPNGDMAGDGVPPFLRRSAPQANGPASGIVTNAPPPNADLEKSLQSVFGLPVGK